MTCVKVSVLAISAVMTAATPLLAKDLALVLANDNYIALPDIRDAAASTDTITVLSNNGFDVYAKQNASGAEMVKTAQEFATVLETEDVGRVVISVAGHMVQRGQSTWILGQDAQNIDLLSIGQQGVMLDALLNLASQHPDKTVVMIERDSTKVPTGPGLQTGRADFDLPEGVLMLEGDTDDMTDVLSDVAMQPGATFYDISRASGWWVSATGLQSRDTVFTPAVVETDANVGELAYWNAARDIGTVAAIEAYLKRYPNGAFADEARAQITELTITPEEQAKRDEEALGLTRDQRRQIQRNLSLLGFNPRGIDGIFGRGSRGAIKAWQTANAYDPLGYLSQGQIDRLQIAAKQRAAELEEQARQRRLEHERRDRAYWDEVGRGQDEASLRAYLAKYPDGLYAEIANARIDEIEAEKRKRAERIEREAWDQMRATDNVAAYQDFLRRFPNGSFANAAKARIVELQEQAQNSEQARKDRADENRIMSNPVTRVLTERQLDRLGLKPGEIDGRFTDTTRRAIRRFQRAQGLPATGYVNQATAVRLLASGIRN